MDTTEKIAGRVVGNTSTAESSVGFKADIQNMIERYAMENVDIARDFERILARENTRNDFIDRVTESVNTTEALSDSAMVSDSFYSNYTERLAQLIDNSCQAIARESVMTGYAPIVAYAPFFIKKQWVACVWKDVLMSEVATSPILNYKFEEDGVQGTIKIALKYNPQTKVSAIKSLTRVSKPGMRKYTGYREMPRVINGLGIAIISTSKGVMTNKEAAELKIGGEVLCYVY